MADEKKLKEINDLAPVSSLSPTAQFAIQMPGAQEAQRTSLDLISKTVASTLETGALAELQTAVSLGKNALAQRLTEKGAPSTPQDSLISMADKLNNLVIENEKQNILGPIVLDASMVGISGERSPFNFRFLNDGYVAVAAGPTLFLIPPGKYENIEAACQAQVAQVNFQTAPSGYVWLGRSRDGNTLIAWTGGTTFEIYDVNYQTPALTFVKAISGISVYSNMPAASISNDRSLFAWYNGWGDVRLAKVDNPEQFCNLRGSDSSGVIDSMFDDENHRVFTLGQGSYDDRTVSYLYEDVYTVTEDGITSVTKSLGPKRGFFFHQADILINCVPDSSVQLPDRITRPKLQVLELMNNYNVLEIELPQCFSSNSPASADTAYFLSGCLGFPILSVGENKWQLFPPAHSLSEMVYDAAAHTLTKKFNYTAAVVNTWNMTSTLNFFFNPWQTPSGGVIEVRSNNESYTWKSFNQEAAYPVSGVKFLGQVRTVNEKTTELLPNTFPTDRVEAGYYDLETRYIELKAAEGEQ